MYSPDLLIDGESRTAVKSGNKYMFRLAAGKHVIALALNSAFSGETTFELTALAGSAHYLRVDTGLALNQRAVGYTPYVRSFDLVSVEDSLAIEQITECCSGEQKNKAKDKSQESKQQHGAGGVSASPGELNTPRGFSTDKTANPFNH